MVLHITEDLMMSSNASSAARAAGHKFKFVASWERASHFISENEIKYLVIDLQTAGLDLDEIKAGLESLQSRPPTLAYAQHVEVNLLDKANQCGFDHVMTRGQAHHRLSEILSQ